MPSITGTFVPECHTSMSSPWSVLKATAHRGFTNGRLRMRTDMIVPGPYEKEKTGPLVGGTNCNEPRLESPQNWMHNSNTVEM